MPAVELTRDRRTATATLSSPILARHVLHELADALRLLAAEPRPVPVVLASAHPTIFLAGADLSEIAELDPISCVPYSELGRSVARRLASHPAPVVAAVHGSCSGGGFDLVLACDWVVASPAASFSHPGVFRGLVTGWGGTVGVELALGGAQARRALLEGAPLDAAAARDLGVIQEIAEHPRARARAGALRIADLDPSRLASWRLLRGPSFVDRFRIFMVEKS